MAALVSPSGRDPIVADWIAADWGTTRLRVWAMGVDGTVRAEASSLRGMGGLTSERYEGALLDLIGHWLVPGRRTDVVICGMAGARQGWAEAPYRSVPCAPFAAGFTAPPVRDPRLRALILPGLSQDRPADVMRGEETQIAGYLSLDPAFDGVLCLPGTHSKWVHVSAGEVISFRTCMTGELFGLLCGQSVLRHAVHADTLAAPDFAAAVGDAMTAPEAFSARLFTIRAEALLHDLSPERARARLSGMLIGLELAATRPYWLGRQVIVLGTSDLARLYVEALGGMGTAAGTADATVATLAGLGAARMRLAAR